MSRESYNYKRQAITAAKHLGYGDTVISALKQCTTESEIDRIMANSRRTRNTVWD